MEAKLIDKELLGKQEKNTSLDESIRFLIPKATEMILDIRNKRDVAHVGKEIDVREMDAILLVRLSNWILSEIIRQESTLDNLEIQELINQLSQKSVPFIEVIDGDVIILHTELSAKEKTLLALFHQSPLTDSELINVVEYKNPSRFKKIILQELNSEKLIHRKGDKLFRTSKGIKFAEEKILPSISN